MKRFLLLFAFVAGVFMCASAAEEPISIISRDGHIVHGFFENRTDSTITFLRSDGSDRSYVARLRDLQHYEYGDVVGHRVGDNWMMFTRVGYKQYEDSLKNAVRELKAQEHKLNMQNPQYALGYSLKGIGKTTLGIGLPSMVLGSILVAVGSTAPEDATPESLISRSRCGTAGMFFLPMGASLTITSIPLMVKGKKLMDVKIQTTGTGAGATLVF